MAKRKQDNSSGIADKIGVVVNEETTLRPAGIHGPDPKHWGTEQAVVAPNVAAMTPDMEGVNGPDPRFWGGAEYDPE